MRGRFAVDRTRGRLSPVVGPRGNVDRGAGI
jgi:hypothetical protein